METSDINKHGLVKIGGNRIQAIKFVDDLAFNISSNGIDD